MNEQIIHALELCMREDWDGAKQSLEAVHDPAADRLAMMITQQQERQRNHRQELSAVRHDIGNSLSIAQANLEAMLDGVMEITPERLRAIADSLRTAGQSLIDLKLSS